MTAQIAVTSTTDAEPVMPQHRFDEAALERFLLEHIPDLKTPITLSQFIGGMSNPTFMITDAKGQTFVMRKKPPGKLLPSAHAVDREFKVISALYGTDVPVARPYVLCEDESVIGQAFYVMEHVRGRVFRNFMLPDMAPSERGAIYDAMNAAIAALHRVDYKTIGLEGFGREGGYCQRQVSRWSKQYEASKTEEVPAMENLIRWLPENMPDADETTIVHGDFRLENMIYHPTEPRVLAVVDWELGTLGHPLSDIAYNCLPWHVPDSHRGFLGDMPASSGIPSEEAYVAAYCERTGRNGIDNWPFYVVLSLFRLGAIAQGVYRRGLDGNASSPQAIERGKKARELAEVGWQIVEKGW